MAREEPSQWSTAPEWDPVAPNEEPPRNALTTEMPPASARTRLIGGIVAALVIVGIFGAIKFINRDTLDKAQAGDCLRTEDISSLRVTDCDDPRAYLKVLRVMRPGEECKDVAGAYKLAVLGTESICLGKKDVDPATATNVAKEGDCVVVRGSLRQRVDCTSPDATHTVLKRLTQVSMVTLAGPCVDVEGAVDYLAWSWSPEGVDTRIPMRPADVVLCLGLKT